MVVGTVVEIKNSAVVVKNVGEIVVQGVSLNVIFVISGNSVVVVNSNNVTGTVVLISIEKGVVA